MSDEPQVTQSDVPVPQEIKGAREDVRKAQAEYDVAVGRLKDCKSDLQDAHKYLYETIDDLSQLRLPLGQGQDGDDGT